MNEKIKELIEHATKHYPATGSSGEFSTFDKEKFAELIVQECIAKVELRKKFAIEDEHVMEHAFDLLVYDIESHFGVKE